jgi:hypothetical protein
MAVSTVNPIWRQPATVVPLDTAVRNTPPTPSAATLPTTQQPLASSTDDASLRSFEPPPPLVAQANKSSAGKPSALDNAMTLLNTVSPDGIVYSNSRLLAAPNAKHFGILNPLAGAGVHFVSHPQDRVTVGGFPMNRVEAVHYSLNGAGTRREDGFGFTKSTGQGNNKLTFFMNGRAGDTNLLLNPNNGASVNLGFFGSPAALKTLVDRMPSGGRAGQFKQALAKAIDLAAAGGNQVGVAWRGTLQLNSSTGKLDLNVSGFKIPLADFSNAVDAAARLNYGNKPVARLNNEEAYLNGANPFDHARATKTPAGQFVNHGDPVSSIAGGVLRLQASMLPDDKTPVRNNADAARVLGLAIERSKVVSAADQRIYGETDPTGGRVRSLTGPQRETLNAVLTQMDRYGVFFGSKAVEQAAKETRSGTQPAPVDNEERSFVRDVFEGEFRKSTDLNGNDGFDTAKDIALGISRWGVVVEPFLNPPPLANNDVILKGNEVDAKAFAARMDTLGGVMKALGLKMPSGIDTGQYEALVNGNLSWQMRERLIARKQQDTSPDARFQEFKALTSAERRAAAASIDRTFNAVGGVITVTDQVSVRTVGGKNRLNGEALQGMLKTSRTSSGSPVYWLQGRSTNYVLKDTQGRLITDEAAAIQRARALITEGAAQDLLPLR